MNEQLILAVTVRPMAARRIYRPQRWLAELLRDTDHLPSAQRVKYLLQLALRMFEVMSTDEVVELRDEMAEEFGANTGIVEMIDLYLSIRSRVGG